MTNRADLHTHTTASDGMFRPAENVRLAKEKGLAAIAITDHDTVAGLSEALEAGLTYGILVVPGVEVSTAVIGKDIHILGYGFQPDDPVFLERLRSLRSVRNSRNDEILAKLDSMGMSVTSDELESVAGKSRSGDGSVGRPHIAQALVDKGYVSTVSEAFDRYLGEGKPAFASPPRITPIDAIRWIQEAGGVAIVAHPGLYADDPLVLSLLDAGADGLEAFHSDHDLQTEKKYEEWASSRGKLVTGGSDFHGVKEGVAFHGDIGSRSVDSAIIGSLTRRSGSL